MPLYPHKQNKQNQNKMKYYERIEALFFPSAREQEIKQNHSTERGIDRAYIREYKRAQLERDAERQKTLKEAWEKLQALRYTKFSHVANGAYDSGHSDYIEHSENIVRVGVQAPDGTIFEGKAIWSEAILPALKHAGI